MVFLLKLFYFITIKNLQSWKTIMKTGIGIPGTEVAIIITIGTEIIIQKMKTIGEGTSMKEDTVLKEIGTKIMAPVANTAAARDGMIAIWTNVIWD
jgi:hypothetical protein